MSGFDDILVAIKSGSAKVTPGLVEAGNIDLTARPVVRNPDGTTSTVRSRSFGVNGKEVLVPTVSDDGRIMSDEEALATYQKAGKHLGIFSSPASATAYAQKLHEDYASGGIKMRAPSQIQSVENPARTPPTVRSVPIQKADFYSSLLRK